MVTLDGLPAPGFPVEVVLGKPAISPTSGSPPQSSKRSVRCTPSKPGKLWDVHGIAIGGDGRILVTDTKCHRVQVITIMNFFISIKLLSAEGKTFLKTFRVLLRLI